MRRARQVDITYYEWNVARWLASSTRMRLCDYGRSIYCELLDLCYTQGSIPNPDRDPDGRLALIAHCSTTPERFDETWGKIKSKFKTHKRDALKLTYEPADVFRNSTLGYIEQQRTHGRSGGLKNSGRTKSSESSTREGVASEQAKGAFESSEANNKNKKKIKEEEDKEEYKTHTENGSLGLQSPRDCCESSSQELFPRGPEPKLNSLKDSDRDKLFNEFFWPNVWAKIGVGAARKAFRSKARTIEDARMIYRAAVAQREAILQRAAHTQSGTPIHPATWINAERYRDEITTVTTLPRAVNGSAPANSRMALIEASRKSLEEVDLSDVELAYRRND